MINKHANVNVFHKYAIRGSIIMRRIVNVKNHVSKQCYAYAVLILIHKNVNVCQNVHQPIVDYKIKQQIMIHVNVNVEA